MTPRSLVPALAALLLAAPGCRIGAAPAPSPLAEAIAADPVLGQARGEALPLRVAVSPVRLHADVDAVDGPDEAALHGARPEPEPIREAVIDALRASGWFRQVAPRGRAGATLESARHAAWEARDDLLVEVEVRSYFHSYLGHVNYLWWLFLYTGGVWPGYFVPVDRYGVGLEVAVRVETVHANPPLLAETYTVRPDQVAVELTPLERGFAGFLDLGALWNVETWLDESNWRAIDEVAAPHAWRRLVLELLRDLEAGLRRPLLAGAPGEREGLLRKLRKRMALVVGVQEYADSRVGRAPHAGADADALAAFWRTAAGGGLVADRDLIVLRDEAATKEGILAALETIRSRVNPSDEVVVTFAGLGATLAGGTACLLPHDADPELLGASALDLAELGAALEALSAERVVAFVDASFAGHRADGRTFAGAAAVEVGAAALDAALGLRAGHAVVLAAQPGQAALSLPDSEAGLFTHVVIAALAGAADADGDGRVLLDEVVGFARREVRGRADLEGAEQEPLALWREPVPIGWPR